MLNELAWEVSSVGALMKIRFNNPLQFLIFEVVCQYFPILFNSFESILKVGRISALEEMKFAQENAHTTNYALFKLFQTQIFFFPTINWGREFPPKGRF